MKHYFKNLKWVFTLGVSLVGHLSQAQFSGSYVFPQSVSYTYGRKPSVATKTAMEADAMESYNYWKTNFVTSSNACGFRRVIFDYYPGTTRGAEDRSKSVSEGIAYGMLLAAYAGDKSLFDDLWNYYKKNTNGSVMHWQIQNCNAVGQNGATDAELDVAMALIVAASQWQSDAYMNDAKNMIRIIREKEVEGGSFILKPGDKFGGSGLTNPSYFSPAYYKVFKTIDAGAPAGFWDAVTAKGYEIIFKADENVNTKNASNRGNGLVPDWCNSNGDYSTDGSVYSFQDQGKNFIYDAVRTPFRAAVDVLWFGSADGAKYCTRLSNWAYKQTSANLNNLTGKYDMNGNPLNTDRNNTFIGCFSLAAMAADPTLAISSLPANGTFPKKTEAEYLALLNSGYTANKNQSPPYGKYFDACFKVMAQFVMSGNFYLPPPDKCTAPNLGSAQSLCKTSPIVLNSGISGATSYVWRKNGVIISGANAASYSTTEAGVFEVLVNQNGCTRRSSVEVASATIKADFSNSIVGSNVVFTNTSLGASDYTWSWKTSAGAASTYASFATTKDAVKSFLAAGSYTIKLDITNKTFGCTGSSSIEKTIVVGTGIGWVADDFNNDWTAQTWIGTDANGNPKGYTQLPKTYCSKDDFLKGRPAVCPNNPCSYLKVDLVGGTDVKYTPFGVNLRETAADGSAKNAVLNLTGVPFVSVKIRSTKDITIGIALNDSSNLGKGDEAGITSDRVFVSLKANKDTILNLDFSTVTFGYSLSEAGSVKVNYKKIDAIQFFPYEFGTNSDATGNSTLTGSISVDWIKIGGKSLPAPAFNLKRDAQGFLVYENPSNDKKTFVPVPDWSKVVRTCGLPSTTITANSCLAEQVRWFNGTTVIGSGFTSPSLGAGIYTVQLINQGGITTDTVQVVSTATKADFLADQINYDVKFVNNSQGYDAFTWNYGDVANDIAGSTIWDIGYHNYKKAVGTAASKQFTVSLTIKDTICKINDTKTQVITVACNKLVKKPVFAKVNYAGCEGKKDTIRIAAVEFAGTYGWFAPLGTTIAKPTNVLDTLLTRVITFGKNAGAFKVQAYNDCGQAEDSVKLAIDTPLSGFTFSSTGLKADFKSTFVSASTPTYAWAFGDNLNGTSVLAAPSYTYAGPATYSVCLTVKNICGTSAKTCQDVKVVALGLQEMEADGSLKVFPTLTSNQISVQLNGKASVQVKDLSGKSLMSRDIFNESTFDVSALPNGVYVISILQDGELLNKQFVKQ